MNLANKNVLVLGLGETGLSAVRWLKRSGASVRVADSRVEAPNASRLHDEFPDVQLITGSFKEETFLNVDLIVCSPGVALSEPVLAQARSRGVPVAGDVELFAQALQNRESKVLAITGSNGKTTVTTMVGTMCQAAGMKTIVAGNIGLPVLDALLEVEAATQRGEKEPDVYVLELSSFQLETTSTLNATAATVLNVSEDHLDRYAGMPEYAATKARIFQGGGVQVLNRDDMISMAMRQPGRTIATFGLDAPQRMGEFGITQLEGESWLVEGNQKLMPVKALPLAGLHNAANALAALALCRAIGLSFAPLMQALREFKGLPHRVEWVVEMNGVSFYDDSKGTNVGATEAALNGMTEKVVLIAGGEGKGQDFSPLKNAVANHARAVVLIGHDANKIEAAIEGCGVPVVHAASMEEAVRHAVIAAQSGDAVLLSPACASFDMFRNYEHRAQVFVAAVKAMQNAGVMGVKQ